MDKPLMQEQEFTAEDWPFADPPNTVVISTRQVLREGYPVLFVSHDSDGDWQVLCGTTTDAKDALVIRLDEALQLDHSIASLADMPRGWAARRRSPGDSWTRESITPETDEEWPSA
jgi:hypothetical protein